MFSTKKIAGLGILAGMAILLVYAVHFPIFPAAMFLEYDPADIPIFLATFMYGPGTGMLLTAIVCVLQGLTVSAKSGIIGILMHFCATGSYVLVAGLIYNRKKSLKSAVIAMCCGVLSWLIAMIGFNLIMTPIFMGTPRDAVLKMLLPVIIPFNLIKASVNSIFTFLLYKKTHLIFKKFFNEKRGKTSFIDDTKLPKDDNNQGNADIAKSCKSADTTISNDKEN